MKRKRCSSCQAWKDGITPMLLAKQLHQTRKKKNNATNFINHHSSDENTHPNFVSTCIGTSKDETTSPSKGRNKKRRVSPSSPPSLPLLRSPPQSHLLQLPSSTPPLSPRSLPPPLLHQTSSHLLLEEECREVVVNKCRGVYEGSFGQALTVFAKLLRHTANEVLGSQDFFTHDRRQITRRIS
jgi:hypothetical protein